VPADLNIHRGQLLFPFELHGDWWVVTGCL